MQEGRRKSIRGCPHAGIGINHYLFIAGSLLRLREYGGSRSRTVYRRLNGIVIECPNGNSFSPDSSARSYPRWSAAGIRGSSIDREIRCI